MIKFFQMHVRIYLWIFEWRSDLSILCFEASIVEIFTEVILLDLILTKVLIIDWVGF